MVFVLSGGMLTAMPQLSRVIGGRWMHDLAESSRDRLFSAHALVYIVAGGGVYSDRRNGSRTVARGDVICVFPDLRHTYGRAQSPQWSEVWLSFTGPLTAAWEAEGLLDRARPVRSPGFDPTLVALFDAVVAALPRREARDQPLLLAQVHRILAEIALREGRGRRADADLAAAAMAVFEEELGAPLDLHAAARRLGVGYDHLRRAFTAAAGCSPTRWRLLRRVERARELLAQGHHLAACAERLGYCDLHHFAKQYKSVTGETPGQVRRRMRVASAAPRTPSARRG